MDRSVIFAFIWQFEKDLIDLFSSFQIAKSAKFYIKSSRSYFT